MTDNGHYQFSSKQGDDIYLVVSPLADGLDTFLERAKALSAGIPKPSGTTADEIAVNVKKSQGENVETGEYPASKLVKSITDGKTYWKVAGLEGKFPKFPVAIWPEIIERDLCPMEKLTKDTYPLDGYTAVYEKNEKGNPRKVVELVKA